MVAVKRYYPVLPAVPKNSSERSKTVFRAAQWLRRQIIQRVEHRRRHIKYCDALLPSWLGYNNNNRFLSQQLTFSSPSQHFLGIPSFLLPLARKLPFIRRPNYCCLATADLLVGLVSQPLAATYVLGSRTLESLSIRKGWSPDIKLCIVWGVFVDIDGHKRG